jgi:hypothetical protein
LFTLLERYVVTHVSDPTKPWRDAGELTQGDAASPVRNALRFAQMLAHGPQAWPCLLHRGPEDISAHPELVAPEAQLILLAYIDASLLGIRSSDELPGLSTILQTAFFRQLWL